MKISLESVQNPRKKWYKNPTIWICTIVLLLVLLIIVFTITLIFRQAKKNKDTHIHYTRLNTNVYPPGYELYRLNVLSNRNPAQQYKLLGDFLRLALFNRSNYENNLPSCPIIYAVSAVDHPEDWRGMLFGTSKYPRNNMPYPYVCYLGVMPNDRRHRLGSILLNQFITEITRSTNPTLTHIQLHTNWENCGAQKLYQRCGFRCNEFTANGYSKPFEPEYHFGHMIRMELNLANIRNLTGICHTSEAVQISQADEVNSTKLCAKNLPPGVNKTCID